MKQTLQSILTASDAVLFPAISRNHSLNSVFCITESDVFRCNEEIAVFSKSSVQAGFCGRFVYP